MTAWGDALADVPECVRGPLTMFVDDAEFIEPSDGQFDATELLNEHRQKMSRAGRAIWAVSRLKLWVFEVRILPAEGQTLDELGAALQAKTGKPMGREAREGDRAVYLFGSAGGSFWASHALKDALGYLDALVGGAEHGPFAIRVRRADLPLPEEAR